MKPDRFSSFDAIVHGHNNGLFILSTAKQIRTAHWHSARISLLSLSSLCTVAYSCYLRKTHHAPTHTEKPNGTNTKNPCLFLLFWFNFCRIYRKKTHGRRMKWSIHEESFWHCAWFRWICMRFCFGKRAFTKHFRLRNCWKTLNQWKNNGQTGFKHTQHTNK